MAQYLTDTEARALLEEIRGPGTLGRPAPVNTAAVAKYLAEAADAPAERRAQAAAQIRAALVKGQRMGGVSSETMAAVYHELAREQGQ